MKNKFLRKSVAKVATLKHISAVGNVPLNELINKLREAVGQSKTNDSFEDENYFSDRPEWFSTDKISLSIDEENLEIGNNWSYKLEVAISNAKYMLFFVTPYSARRPDGYCLNELA